jgi:phosphoribosylanthranilate isomerase
MFDTKVGSQSGGTGVSFDWKIINELDIPLPYFLSGGLSHETVNEALEVLSGNPPMAIDVSSKIEESIGIKDFDKLSLFMEAVQSTT